MFLITVGVFATGIIEPKVGRDGAIVLLALGLSFPLASLKTIPSVILERKLDFSKLVFPQIVEQLTYNGLLVFFAMQGYGVRSYTTAVLARSIIGVVVMYAIQRWPIGPDVVRWMGFQNALGGWLLVEINIDRICSRRPPKQRNRHSACSLCASGNPFTRA